MVYTTDEIFFGRVPAGLLFLGAGARNRIQRWAGMDMELEGRGLMEACRREAIGTMDQGVRLAAQGKLDEALECLREAKTLMPRNPRLLLNFAYMGIAKLQRHGWRHDLETEVRKAITAARQIVPGEKRCGELLVQLEALC